MFVFRRSLQRTLATSVPLRQMSSLNDVIIKNGTVVNADKVVARVEFREFLRSCCSTSYTIIVCSTCMIFAFVAGALWRRNLGRTDRAFGTQYRSIAWMHCSWCQGLLRGTWWCRLARAHRRVLETWTERVWKPWQLLLCGHRCRLRRFNPKNYTMRLIRDVLCS